MLFADRHVLNALASERQYSEIDMELQERFLTRSSMNIKEF
jgi:hypothetical protein